MAYRHTGDWTWEFYPPPYAFLAPCDSSPMPAPVFYTPPKGLGRCGCGCSGTCECAAASGLGLFDSGFDLTQWGIAEWATVGIGLYLATSLFGDVKRVGGRLGRRRRASQSKSRRREQLQRQLEALG